MGTQCAAIIFHCKGNQNVIAPPCLLDTGSSDALSAANFLSSAILATCPGIVLAADRMDGVVINSGDNRINNDQMPAQAKIVKHHHHITRTSAIRPKSLLILQNDTMIELLGTPAISRIDTMTETSPAACM